MRMLARIALLVGLALPECLAAQTAAPTAQDRLWDASIAGDTAAMRAAIADGADVHALDTRRSRNGRRALNWAALNDHVPAIELLLSHGADIEAINITGFSALHHAAEMGSVNAARALLAAGADPEHRNNEGWLPSETARERGNFEVAALLEEAMRQEE